MSDDQDSELTPEEDEELGERIEEIRRGEFLTEEDFFNRRKRRNEELTADN